MLVHKLIGALSSPTIKEWDVGFAVYNQSFSVSSQTVGPTDLRFKPDGTKMYVISDTSDVYEYALSTAWDISSASYTSTFDVVTGENLPNGIEFKTDGTKMYVVGQGLDRVAEFTLSAAWDITSASYVQAVAAGDTVPRGLYIRPDGLRMYVIGATGDTVRQFSLSSAWNVSTATFTQAFYIATQDSIPTSVFFKDDGTRMYVVGLLNDTVHQYALGTAWDVSTATLQKSFSVAAQDISPEGLVFSTDGTKMYICGNTGDAVYQYNLT